jgi:hypothetical protein
MPSTDDIAVVERFFDDRERNGRSAVADEGLA